MAKLSESKQKEIIKEAIERYEDGQEKWKPIYDLMKSDLKFIIGGSLQWPSSVYNRRTKKNRPCLSPNFMQTIIDIPVGEQRQSKKSMIVKAFDRDADKKVADKIAGLYRNIEYNSDANTIRDDSFEYMLQGSIWAYHVDVQYTDINPEDPFEQEIVIKPFESVENVLIDPYFQKRDTSDKKWAIEFFEVTRDEYKRRFGKEAPKYTPIQAFNPLSNYKKTDWNTKDHVMVVKYWRVIEEDQTKIYHVERHVPNNNTGELEVQEYDTANLELFSKEDGWEVVKERIKTKRKIEKMVLSEKEILEGPVEWKGNYIPIVILFGKMFMVESQRHVKSLIRDVKHSQMLYNYLSSSAAEQVTASKPQWLVHTDHTDGIIKWANLEEDYTPVLYYNKQTDWRDKPQLIPPAQVSTAMAQSLLNTKQEIFEISNINEAFRGMRSNETSGIAIEKRQIRGFISTLSLLDNAFRAYKFEGKIVVDLIPHIYDKPRVARILNENNEEETITINSKIALQDDPEKEIRKDSQLPDDQVFDFTVGKYDVFFSIGPGFQTLREEISENLLQIIKTYPDSAPLLVPVFIKMQDFPYSEEIFDKLQRSVPENMLNADELRKRFKEEEEKRAMMQELGIEPNGQSEFTPEMVEELMKIVEENKKKELELEAKGNEIEISKKELELKLEKIKFEQEKINESKKEK